MHKFAIAGIIRDEEKTIPWFLKNIAFLKKFGLSNITWLDTGSVDGTVGVVKSFQDNYVVPIHLYHHPFEDYGTSRTRALRLAPVGIPWLFVLDPDELVFEKECSTLQEMLSSKVELWYVPRKKWGDLEMTDQRETYAYPDWQCRLVRNLPHVGYTNKVHEMIATDSCQWHHGAFHIHHFEPVWRSSIRLANKYRMYRELQASQTQKTEPVPSTVEIYDPGKGISAFLWHHDLSSFYVPGMTEHGYPDYNWEYDFVMRHIPQGRHTVLDAGGGTGTLQIVLAKEGHQVHNVDADPQIVSKIQQVNRRFGTNVTAYHSNLQDMPGPSGNVDVIVSVSSLEHNTPDVLARVWEQLVRKLRPGGHLIVTLPLAARDTGKWDPRVHPLWRWSAPELRRAITHPQLSDVPEFAPDPACAQRLAAHYPGTRDLYPVGIHLVKK